MVSVISRGGGAIRRDLFCWCHALSCWCNCNVLLLMPVVRHLSSVLYGELRVFSAHSHDAMSLLLILFTSAFSKLFTVTEMKSKNRGTPDKTYLSCVTSLRQAADANVTFNSLDTVIRSVEPN